MRSDYELSGGRMVPPGLDVVLLPGGRTQVRGSWKDCEQAIYVARSSGRLLASTAIRPDGTGLFLVEVQMVPMPGPRVVIERLPWYRAEPGLAATAGVIGVGMLAAAVWAVKTVLPVLPELGRWLLAVVFAALIVWFLAGQVEACPGIHCPGCKCGR